MFGASAWSSRGLQFARRADARGRFYFVSNPGEKAIDGWVPFESTAPSMLIFDPMTGRRGNAVVRSAAGAAGGREVYLQMPPGGSLVVAASATPVARTLRELPRGRGERAGRRALDAALREGRPDACRPARTIDRLTSWTVDGEDAANFSGTASYTATFARPPAAATAWQIDLGQVRESARVRLNGRDVASLIGPQYRFVVDRREPDRDECPRGQR